MYLTFGATGGAYGVNVRIHSFKNSNPTLDLNSSFVPEDSKDKWREVQLTSPIRVNTVFADGYYLFNGKKFSYAAAYDTTAIHIPALVYHHRTAKATSAWWSAA